MAEDVVRPVCKCHGEPMLKDGVRGNRQAWQCGVKERARQAALYTDPVHAARKRARGRELWPSAKTKERYQERKERGICTKCGCRPLLSEALCWNCLNYLEERHFLEMRGV